MTYLAMAKVATASVAVGLMSVGDHCLLDHHLTQQPLLQQHLLLLQLPLLQQPPQLLLPLPLLLPLLQQQRKRQFVRMAGPNMSLDASTSTPILSTGLMPDMPVNRRAP